MNTPEQASLHTTGRDRADNDGIPITFRLDPGLGPNRAQVMLVMCHFPVELSGEFSLAVHGDHFRLLDLDLQGAPFDLQMAEDFPVHLHHIHIQLDPEGRTPEGGFSPAPAGMAFSGQAPICVSLQADFYQAHTQIRFCTPLRFKGSIDQGTIQLQGSFEFHLQDYTGPDMRTKLGTCHIRLNASSQLAFSFDPKPGQSNLRLNFAGQQATARAQGRFAVGLDGLDMCITQLDIQAEPVHFPEVLETGVVSVGLDPLAGMPAVDFVLEKPPDYTVRAQIPARLSTWLTFPGFAPQQLDAPLRMDLAGQVSLDGRLRLELQQQAALSIADGTVHLLIQARLLAQLAQSGEISAFFENPRRQRTQALRTLRGSPDAAGLAMLEESLHSPELSVRLQAVASLGALSARAAKPLLRMALADPNPEVRAEAARACGAFSRTAPRRLLRRISARDPDPQVRLAALLATGELPGETWRFAARRALTDPDVIVRCQAAILAGQRNPDRLRGELRQALRDPSPFVALCAGRSLLPVGDERALVRIVQLVGEDPDICVQMVGCIALGHSRHPHAAACLHARLGSQPDVYVQQAALYALARHTRDG